MDASLHRYIVDRIPRYTSRRDRASLDGRACKHLNEIVIHFKMGFRHMPPNKLVQARIDRAVTEEAAAVLAAMGLTVSGALRLLLTKVAHEKALPFAPLVPNAATIEAMREARRGNLPKFASVEELFDDLHADD